MTEWKPIRTHNTRVAEGRKPILGGAYQWVGEVYWCKETEKYYLQNTHHTDHVDGSVDFLTHWMPLPASPTPTTKQFTTP